MSYESKENSVDLGSPVTLFEFIYGLTEGDAYRYSTTVDAVTLAGRAWQPHNLKHSEITSAGSLDRSELTITARSDIEVARLFIAAPPSQPVVVNIWRGHALTGLQGWDEFKRIWTGRVLNTAWLEADVEFKCEPIATSAKRVGLRRNYQYGCPHVLYGTACTVSELANTAQAKVVSVINSATLVLQLLSPPAEVTAARLLGGVFKLTLSTGRQVLRSITSAQIVAGGVQVSLMSGVPEAAVGLRCSVSRGCRHTFDDCRTFNNASNFGGCPNIPTKDA
ncbi:MAG: phage BR0599 family protein, partial [Pseudomonas sp.]|nr:phage BR0599 family protein [Pseudomonas sp.]